MNDPAGLVGNNEKLSAAYQKQPCVSAEIFVEDPVEAAGRAQVIGPVI